MAMKIYKLTCPGMFLLTEGSAFRIINNTYVSDVISENNTKRLIDFLDGVEVKAIVDRIKAGEILDILTRTLTFAFEGPEYSASNFMAMTITINGAAMSSWTGTILRDEGVCELPTGSIYEIYMWMMNSSVLPSKSYSMVKTVEELPDNPSRTDIAYLLLKACGNKRAGTAWRWNGEKWVALTEGEQDDPDPVHPEPPPSPIPEPDPMDDSTYPDSENKEDEPQTIGGTDVYSAEVVDGNITETTTIRATDLAFVVNCTMGDGVINSTVVQEDNYGRL